MRPGYFAGSQGQPSKFELAHTGTLHLEEIDALPLEMQGALLRVVDSGEVMRLGGTRVTPVDVRFVATASADVERQVISGDFRADLFYALSRISIRLPALRDRISDLPLIVNATLDRLRRQSGRRVEVSTEAGQVLRRYRWPGNVRDWRMRWSGRPCWPILDSSKCSTCPIRSGAGVGRWNHRKHVPAMHEAEYEAIIRAASAVPGQSH